MSIETKAALQDVYEVLQWSEPTHSENAQEVAEKKAIATYALAVMEKALMVGSADHIDDYDTGADALRKEIEELGR